MNRFLALAALVVLLLFPAIILANSGPAAAGPEPGEPTEPFPMWIGIVMLVVLFTGFFAMTYYDAPLPLVMAIVACIFLVLQGTGAHWVLGQGFKHYADIVILFTAVAIPAHLIERSKGFEWVAAWIGYQYGRIRLMFPRLATPLLVFFLLFATYVTAGLMHNVTSILIMTPIIIRLFDTYRIPSRWILCGALVASNLGGFSTSWGDTPNIVESRSWGLKPEHFVWEVMPANLLVLLALSLVVQVLTQWSLLHQKVSPAPVTGMGQTFQDASTAAEWKRKLKLIAIDKRLLAVGLVCLVAFIVLHVVFDEWKFAIGCAAIVAVLLLERPEDRFHSLKSLGFDVYLAFAAIFVLAGCVEKSWIGETLSWLIGQTGGAPWMIAVTGYLGTMFTEAASWATAVSDQISGTYPAHAVAWALGGGICAGSSSIVTAASAGIILAEESSRFKEPHAITFRRYLPFGLGFSLFMLIFYSVYFTLVRF